MKTLTSMLSGNNPRFAGTEALIADANTAIKATIASNNGYTKLNAKSLPFKMEGFNDSTVAAFGDSLKTLTEDLHGVPQFEQLICRRLGKEKITEVDPSVVEDIYNRAAYSMLAAQSPDIVLEAYAQSTTSFLGAENAVISMDSGKQAPVYKMEAFDPATVEKYMGLTAVINALSTVQNQFMDVWFPTELIAAGETGRTLVVAIPKILIATPRVAGGQTTTITKISINEAILDPSILDTFATDVIPHASSTTLPAVLVTNAVIPTFQRKIGQVSVDTRPIAIGAEIKDVIGMLADAPGILGTGVFNFTDQLDPVMNIGELYYKITAVTGNVTKAAVFKADISNQPGARLTAYAQGRPQDYQTNMLATLVFNGKSEKNNGDTTASIVGQIQTILGLGSTDKFEFRVTTRLSATANTEFGSFLVNANNTEISELYGNAGESLSPALLQTGSGNSVTITILGYIPTLRRTNTNIRDYGTLIDPNFQLQFLYPVRIQAPLTSVTPISGGQLGVPVETLMMMAEVRNSGHCLQVLQQTAEILANFETNGIPAYSPMPGALFVKPFYQAETIDVTQLTFGMNAFDGIANLEATFTNAIKIITSRMVKDTNFVAAMKAFGLPDDGYEFILLTDPRLSGYVMTQGDSRTVGDNKSFTKAVTALTAIKDKIYISMRRKSRPEAIHPLDFGVFLKAPEIVVEVQIPRDGGMRKEVQVLPRGDAYVLLPVLAVITVEGMDTIYVNAPVAP